MTINEDQYYSGIGYEEDEPQVYDAEKEWAAEPVPVVSMGESAAPEYGACMTWPVQQAGVGQPVQILQRRVRRHKAKIYQTSPSGSGATDFPQANPPAGTNFTYTVPPGTAQTITAVRVFFTTSAAVANRFVSLQVRDASGNILSSINNASAIVASSSLQLTWSTSITGFAFGASGNALMPMPITTPLQPGWQLVVTISGEDAADQLSQIVITLANAAASIIINSKLDPLQGANPQGFTIPAGFAGNIEWESQQPCYAIAIGGTANLSVTDEAYAER